VSRDEKDTGILQELIKRGQANGARVEWVGQDRLREIEPHAVGIGALWAPEGASFDSRAYVNVLAEDARARGVEINLQEPVMALAERDGAVDVRTSRRTLRARVFVNAAGLHADRLAHLMNVGRNLRVVPFRGEYVELRPAARALVRSHVYPTPDPRFPFLGVHLSRRVDGSVTAGPGAVLATGREAYERTQFNPRDLVEMATYPGFWRMMRSDGFVQAALREGRKTLFKKAVLEEARLLVPELRLEDLGRRWSGIRAQLVSRDGTLVDDLVVEETERSVHVLNAVSPALTCSLPFGESIAQRVLARL
jgi:L-2-hydroxyglutarate oxidase